MHGKPKNGWLMLHRAAAFAQLLNIHSSREALQDLQTKPGKRQLNLSSVYKLEQLFGIRSAYSISFFPYTLAFQYRRTMLGQTKCLLRETPPLVVYIR